MVWEAGRHGQARHRNNVLTLKVSDLVNLVAAGFEDAACQPVANDRGNMDPVSLMGVHAGVLVKTIRL